MRRLKETKGFTLIELLIVVVILGVLIAIVVGATGGSKDSANDAKAKADLTRIQTALEECYARTGEYPAGTTLAAAETAAGTLSGTGDNCLTAPFDGGTLPTNPNTSSAYGYNGTATSYTLTADLSTGDSFTLNSKQ